jgi:hypothetical protein
VRVPVQPACGGEWHELVKHEKSMQKEKVAGWSMASSFVNSQIEVKLGRGKN